MIILLTAAVDSGNQTTFKVVDDQGVPINLTALNVSVVTVEVCGTLADNGAAVSINSTNSDVQFSDDTITVKFGQLNLESSSSLHYPKISYITDTNSKKEVIVGKGYRTEIKLKVIC
jgi:hypothetical protein